MKLRIAASALLLSTFLHNAAAQQAGYMEQEEKPYITLKECTLSGGCTSKQAKLTLDANWRWIHHTSGYENCYTGDAWNPNFCSDPVACARDCALEGVSADKYRNTYGIEQLQHGVKLNFVTDHQFGTNVGSRLYIMDGDDKYKMFYLKNREFAIDVDVSDLFCGMNGAMYFSEMDEYGGKGLGNNNAGAKYGTGYCDAQCPHDIKFISGEANSVDWVPNPKDEANNMGIGKYGSCCAEMDIWEANSMATAYTPHPCDMDGQLKCEGLECGDTDKGERYLGVCDKDGCDINPYRMGNPNFYGRGSQFAVDTTKKMTVVTQFLTTDGTDTGDLSEIRRFYVQDGQIIASPSSTILGPDDSDSITDGFCAAKKALFGDVNDFDEKGGNKGMGDSLDRGHVAVLSLWDDVEVNMLWLDSAYPLDKAITEPGVKRGECPGGVESTPTYLRDTYPNGHVIFENVAIGEIGSTLQDPSPTAPTPSPPGPTPPTGGQCGCGPADGQNQPECVGNTETRCNQMIQYEGKCKWTDCNDSPAPTTKAPTESPTVSPSRVPTGPPVPVEGCFSANFKDCVPPGFPEEEVCDKIWLPTGAQSGCTALWGECTGQEESSCCGPASCVGTNTYAACVPDSDGPTPSPVPPACTECTDDETWWMANNGKDCTTSDLINTKCNKDATWTLNKYCQLSCYLAGNGYEGDVCCTSATRHLRKRATV